MKEEELNQNPIKIIKENTTLIVFERYERQIKESISAISLNRSEYNSFNKTFALYAEGRRLRKSLMRLHWSLRKIIIDTMPIKNVEAFFTGSFEEQKKEALATAKRMMDTFEQVHSEQKKSLETA